MELISSPLMCVSIAKKLNPCDITMQCGTMLWTIRNIYIYIYEFQRLRSIIIDYQILKMEPPIFNYNFMITN